MELMEYSEMSEYDSAVSTPTKLTPLLPELEREDVALDTIVDSEPCKVNDGIANGEKMQRYVRVGQWGRKPQEFICRNCKMQQISKIEFKVGSLNWVMTALCTMCLCLCICWLCLPCGIVPLFMDSLKDLNHICPNCGFVNGTKKQLD